MTDEKDISELSFEEALKQLQEIVLRLEKGETDLETAINDYTLGTQLKKHCENKLAEAKLKVEKIIGGENGEAKTELFE